MTADLSKGFCANFKNVFYIQFPIQPIQIKSSTRLSNEWIDLSEASQSSFWCSQQ